MMLIFINRTKTTLLNVYNCIDWRFAHARSNRTEWSSPQYSPWNTPQFKLEEFAKISEPKHGLADVSRKARQTCVIVKVGSPLFDSHEMWANVMIRVILVWTLSRLWQQPSSGRCSRPLKAMKLPNFDKLDPLSFTQWLFHNRSGLMWYNCHSDTGKVKLKVAFSVVSFWSHWVPTVYGSVLTTGARACLQCLSSVWRCCAAGRNKTMSGGFTSDHYWTPMKRDVWNFVWW